MIKFIIENYKLLGIGFIALLITTACVDSFDELNVPDDKIAASDVDGGLLGQAFAQAQFGVGHTQQQLSEQLYANIYSQYFATIHPRFNSDQFLEISGWTNGYYRTYYSTVLPQLLFVERFTEENSLPVENAMAKVMRVEAYQRLTDFFGPTIYNEFGNEETSVPFDSQELIYKDFFNVLDEAVAVLNQNNGGNAFGSHDLIYGGDVTKWLAFANSLRLRIAMRISYIDPVLAKSEAEKAVAAGVISDNSGNAGVASGPNSLNGVSRWTYIQEFAMSATMESILKGYNDPRLEEYFNEAGDRVGGTNGYLGARNGMPAGDKVGTIKTDFSFVDTKWLPITDGGASVPNPIINASGVLFLRAEGALRGWNMGGTAKDLYEAGIRMSLTQWTSASSVEIDTYIAGTTTPVPVADAYNSPAVTDIPVAYQGEAGFETKLEQIITQKWLANYPHGRESWAERRRTGYPKGYAIINSLNPDVGVGELMRRLKFASIERTTNAEELAKAEGLLSGPDENQTRLWWDAKSLGEFPTPTN